MKENVFNKEAFIEDVKENVKNLYRKTLDEASQQEIFQAVSYTVKDVIIDDWLATQKAFDKQDPKMVYYMSMEFLMGRALGNNMINLKMYKEVKRHSGDRFNLMRSRIRSRIRTWKWWTRTSCSLLYGISGNLGIRSLRLRYPLPLWYVQTEDQRRFSGGSAG